MACKKFLVHILTPNRKICHGELEAIIDMRRSQLFNWCIVHSCRVRLIAVLQEYDRQLHYEIIGTSCIMRT